MNRWQKKLKDKRHLERIEEKLKYDGAKTAIDVLSVLPAYVLMDEFGFGQKRLIRFMRRFIKTYRAVIEKQVAYESYVYRRVKISDKTKKLRQVELVA